MIRPIDAQILHPQTPIIAGREQRSNHLPVEQQSQFGDIMQKEVTHKKDTVVAPQNPEHLKSNKDGAKQSAHQNKKGSKKKQEENDAEKDKTRNNSATKIDIRI
ncbi:MAG TPA: hypothetical protein GX707_02550 [Epulopiscium sp.]|nr:hypothetical protein [Candidatus Epulonipiscium sp.]